jgi:Rod binding domain-containing protein
MNIEALKPHIDASEIAPERLAGNTALTDKQKIAEASRQFESILLKQILESAQKTVIKSKYSEDSSTASSIYHDMVTTQLADSISKSGEFGLAKSFEQQLDQPTVSTPKLLDPKASTLSTAEHHTTNSHSELSHKNKISAHSHAAARTLKPLHE